MKKVFFIDDDQFVTSMYKAKLQAEGLQIDVANSGEEAITLLSSMAPDLVVLDLHMPNPNGVEVLKFIRNTDSLKNLPVIVFSSGFVQTLVEEVGDLGAQKFLAKNQCPPNKLVEEIKDSLANLAEPAPATPSRSALETAAESAPGGTPQDIPGLLHLLTTDARPEEQHTRLVTIYKVLKPMLQHAAEADASTPRGKLSRVLKKLFEDLYDHPAHITPSTTQTLSHGLKKLIDLCEQADRTALNSETELRNILADLGD